MGFLSPFVNTGNVFERAMMSQIAQHFFNDSPELQRTNRQLFIRRETYTDDNENKDACAVCQSEFQKEEKVTTLDCDHTFHVSCIEEWGRYKAQCPMCRQEIPIVGTDHGFGQMIL
jgi:hypothetical protein